MNAVNKSHEQPYMDQLLAESEANSLSGHASDATITNLRGELETMANDLRTPVESDPFLKEPACSDAVEKARAIAKETIQTTAASKMEGAVHADVSQIGPYKILALLGQGGMGAVYKALHPRLEKIVALKVLTPGRLKSHDAVGRFEREMKAIGKLDHPHLIRALDAGEADGAHYLAMEYVDGIDLSHLIKSRGPLPIAEACELVIQAASGLQAAHTRGMVHRDIKPANLMLARQEFGPPVVKVLDLGLALLSDTNAPDVGGLTSDGQVMGTVDYMAPEQATDSHSVDIRADIYSLGATLYALLTGGSLFQGKPNQSLMQKLMTLAKEAAPPIRDRRPEVSVALAAVVHRMIAKDARERYATPAEVIAALKPFARDANLASLDSESGHFVSTDSTSAASYEGTVLLDSVQTGGPTLPQVMLQSSHQQPPRRRWIPTAIAGAAIAAVGLLAVVLLTLKTPQGDVVVEIPGDLPAEVRKQIKISVTGDGVAEVASEANGWKVGIKEGKYSVELTGGGDQVQVDDKQVIVSRHKKAIVTITTKPTGTVAANTTKPADGASDLDRMAAEWLLSLKHPPKLDLAKDGNPWMSLQPGQPLPAEKFHLYYIQFNKPEHEELGDEFVDELAKHLRGVTKIPRFQFNGRKLTAAGLAKLIRLPEFADVQDLVISPDSMDDSMVADLAAMKKLTSLRIDRAPMITGKNMGFLKGIVGLILPECRNLTPEGLEELQQLPLELLDIGSVRLTEKHITAIAGHKTLRRLHSQGIEDSTVAGLANMKNLVWLGFENSQITDKGLQELKQFMGLKTVNGTPVVMLTGSKATPEGIADLKKSLPNCRIE
ncbi:MAG: serine/threonine-protein kinase [Planctomycetota bacterium]